MRFKVLIINAILTPEPNRHFNFLVIRYKQDNKTSALAPVSHKKREAFLEPPFFAVRIRLKSDE